MTLISDTTAMVGRNLLTIRRVPTLLVGATLQPLVFVFLFAYVFGSTFGGDSYREYLMAGIFTQTVVFNCAFTTVGLGTDLQQGFIGRLRTLPMSSTAVILGRTASDLLVSVLAVAVMTLTGLAIGWRVRGSLADAAAALGIIVLFGFAMSWVGAYVGLATRNLEVAQSVGMIVLFPLTFLSSAFISVQTLPTSLRTIAEWNPVTAVATSSRALFGNAAPPSFPTPDGWVADHAAAYAIAWSVAIIAVFVPAAVLRFRHAVRR